MGKTDMLLLLLLSRFSRVHYLPILCTAVK